MGEAKLCSFGHLTHWGRDKRPPFSRRHFKWIFLNEYVCISLGISLKFVPKVRINNILALVQIMTWHRPGDKPLSEPIMVSLLRHICVTLPQWVNWLVTKSVDVGRRESRHSLKSHDGIGSLLPCLFGECFISFLISSSDRGWKESTISSFTDILGIVMGSAFWLSMFVLIFWILIP